MIRFITIILLVLAYSSSAKIIQQRLTFKTTTKEHKITGAYCDIKFDTNNYNYVYDCFGVKLTNIIIKDANDFVVGERTIYDNDNHGTLYSINGTPSYISGKGKVYDTTTFFIGCDLGYELEGDKCVTPCGENEFRSYFYGNCSPGCLDGYDEIGGYCISR